MRSTIGVIVVLSSILAGDGSSQTLQDSVAVGPIREPAKLTASDGAAGNFFGVDAVAVAHNTVVVGVQYAAVGENIGQGAAYVFRRTRGRWKEVAKLTASDGAAQQYFGWSVAVAGGTVVVGAPGAQLDGISNRGAVYVFTRTGGSWTETQKLTPSDGAVGDVFWFGGSVAVAGDTVAVGAGPNSSGAAYVFTRTGESWTEKQKLTPSDGVANAGFANSVDIAGDTIVIGAPFDHTFHGAAYMFTRAGETWTETAKLTASDWTAVDRFGTSVAVAGETVVIGQNIGGAGAAYVFSWTREGWVEMAKLVPPDGTPGSHFGYSVAAAGDTVVVGAPEFADQGALYVFKRIGGAWTETAKRIAPDGAAGDLFGYSVAVAGGTVVGTAPAATIGENAYQGAAYVFARPTRQRGSEPR